jgi:formate-dependent nitrite reductase cytochrome c552 subunit
MYLKEKKKFMRYLLSQTRKVQTVWYFSAAESGVHVTTPPELRLSTNYTDW